MLKNSILAIFLFSSFSTFAAQTVAKPFKFEFYAPTNKLNFQAELQQSCRYEKIVWGDSSEYNTEFKNYRLPIKSKKLGNGLTRFSVELDKRKTLSVDGIFKPTKGCMSNLELKILDANYAVGWAGKMSTPITFKLTTNDFYRGGDTVLDISDILTKVEDRELSYQYKDVGGNQFNIALLIDGSKLSNLFIKTAAKNKKTGMPYRLK